MKRLPGVEVALGEEDNLVKVRAVSELTNVEVLLDAEEIERALETLQVTSL